MHRNLSEAFQRLCRGFKTDCSGSTAVQFALAIVPIAGLIGLATDYTQASRVRADLQGSLDAATLAGAKDGSNQWKTTALNVFAANATSAGIGVETPNLQKDADGKVTGSLSITVPTEIAKVIGIKNIAVGVRSTALVKGVPDKSCILTLGDSADLEGDSMVFNGAPRLKFDQCTIRSNTSMRCNGHNGGSIASVAAGDVDGCSNPQPDAVQVPDIYAPLAQNITKLCGNSKPGAVWTPGVVPTGNAVKLVSKPGYTEFHICGELTLAGSGDLTGAAPVLDTVIVVENGGLTMDDKASISTRRVTFVLTGDGTNPASITFPNGNGKAATLALSPSTDAANPWHGISLYQDPALTDVDSDWGPAATFNPDGVVYMPKADVVMSGNASSKLSGCTKIVTKTFRTNGSVDISFKQDTAACANLGVQQWSELASYLGG